MLTVLMYHSIGAPEEGGYDVSADVFERQMRLIADSKSTTLGISEAMQSNSKNGVLVTFDDGHATVLCNALPIMRDLGIGATLYVTTGYVGSEPRWLDWDQLEVVADHQVDIQAHGHSHRFLNSLSHAELSEELKRPRELLFERMEIDVRHLALPGGRGSAQVYELAGEEGYETVATSQPGLWRGAGPSDTPQLINRFCVMRSTRIGDFERMIVQDRGYAARTQVAYSGKRLARRVIGDRFYQSLWARIKKGRHT